jgi:hypothetical protein
LEKLQKELIEKEAEVTELSKEWNEERQVLKRSMEIKRVKN